MAPHHGAMAEAGDASREATGGVGEPVPGAVRSLAAARFGRPGRRMAASPLIVGMFASLGVLITIAVAFGVRRAGTVIVILIVAGFLAIGLDRPVMAMVRHGLRRSTAVLLLIVAAVVVVCGGVGLLVPIFAREVGRFFDAVPGYVDELMAKRPASTLDSHTDVAGQVSAAVTPHHLAALASGVLGGVSSVAGALFFAVTTAMLTLLLLWRLPSLKEGGYRLVVASRRERVRLLVDEMLNKIGSYLVGAVLVALCAGGAAFLWTYFAGVAYPFVMAVIVAVFDLIPQVGATIGSVVVTLVAWTHSLGLAIATIAFFCLYQAVENWLVYPRVMSRALKISNLAAVVAALLGGAVFGVLGVLLAVPVYASVQLIVREVLLPRQDAR
jgi:predicted PurR-regulated permease PerM